MLFTVTMALADGPLHIFYGDQPQDNLGYSIAGVGDVNQDGNEDYLVGAPFASRDGKTANGAVYLVSGANGSPLSVMTGEMDYDNFGYNVACAGDVNLDGVNDFMIMAAHAFGGIGGVYVYSGSDSMLLYPIFPPMANSEFGHAMTSVGDRDADGVPDLVIGAPFSGQTGEVFLFSGVNGYMIINAWSGVNPYDAFGQSIATADADGDGALDLFISAPGSDTNGYAENGVIYCVPANTGQLLLFAEGQGPGQFMGHRIAALTDTNGDGVRDIAATDFNGSVHIYSGAKALWLNSFPLGLTPYEMPDWVSIAPAGDFNGDGIGDLLAGRPEADSVMGPMVGTVTVLSGSNGALLQSYEGQNPYDRFGICVVADADVDGNGQPDYLMGADFTDNPSGNLVDAGAVFVYHGVGTPPVQNDSDNDGMPDDWENQYGLNPMDPLDAAMDFDGDGLTNLAEYQNGTDPFNPDCDYDGIPDGWEVSKGLNPNWMDDAFEDNDGDQLINIDEYHANADPHNADSDGDTLPDGWEWSHGLNPNDPNDAAMDTDGDGLTNLQEYNAGTCPDLPDTDGDGLSDGDEINTHQTDPLVADSDGDGLSDGEEVLTYFSDPNSVDSDGDGMPDGWEVGHDLDPTVSDDADSDTDGDGFTSLQEFQADTDPNDATNYPGGPGTLRWSYAINQDIFGIGVATDGSVYFVAGDRKLYAVGPDGAMEWSYDIGSFTRTAPSIGQDGTIYIAYSGYLAALEPSGTLKWKTALGVSGTPGYALALGQNDTIYVSIKNRLMALNQNGTIAWSATTDGYHTSAPAVAADGTIYVKSYNDTLYAFKADGTLSWSYVISTSSGYAYGSPALGADGTIYVCGNNDTLNALNPDGTLKWSMIPDSWNSYTTPIVAVDGTIYVSTPMNLSAVASDGSLQWQHAFGQNWYSSVAVGNDGTIYVAGQDYPHAVVYALNSDGSIKWSYNRNQKSRFYTDVVLGADGGIYIGCDYNSSYPDAKLYVLNSASEGELNAPWPLAGHDMRNTGNGQGQAVPDLVAPEVLSTVPGSNATDVSISSAITATFSEAVDPDTVTSGTFIISGDSGVIQGTIDCSDASASFTPSEPLSYNSQYTLTLTTGIADLAGNNLEGDYTISFTTESCTTCPSVSVYPATAAIGIDGGEHYDWIVDGQVDAIYERTAYGEDVLVSRNRSQDPTKYWNYHGLYEFNIIDKLPSRNVTIVSATLELDAVYQSAIPYGHNVFVKGYVGNGSPDLEDFGIGASIGQASVGDDLEIDVTDFIKSILQADDFAGFILEPGELYENSVSFWNGTPHPAFGYTSGEIARLVIQYQNE